MIAKRTDKKTKTSKGFEDCKKSKQSRKQSKQSKTKPKSQQEYKLPKGWIFNPFDFLGKKTDFEISKNEDILEIYETAQNLDEKIEGDFDLDHLTFRIKLNSLSYIETGLTAAQIRFKRLYKERYRNFTDYCKYELGRSRSYIDRLITAATVSLELIINGFDVIPRNESQCRLLSPYKGTELIKRWEAYLSTIEPHQITAETLKQFLADEDKDEQSEPEESFVKIPKYLESVIYLTASKLGLTTTKLIIVILEGIFKPAKFNANWRDFERQENWENDLEQLIKEGEGIVNST